MHYVKDFKGFAEAQIDLFERMTILIGPNGSGKSNLIEAIELLAAIARGCPLHEVSDVHGGGTVEVRGGLEACARFGCDRFTLGFRAATPFDGEPKRGFDYHVTVEVRPIVRICGERLCLSPGGGNQERTVFETEDAAQSSSDAIAVRFDNFDRSRNKPRVLASAARSVISQYKSFACKAKKFSETSRLIDHVIEYLRASFVFCPDPQAMREYSRVGDQVLRRNGSNLSSVLFALGRGGQPEQDMLRRILGYIQQIPEEPYEGIEFVKTELHDVMLALRRQGTGQRTDTRVLSDGTLRALAVLAAVATVKNASRVVVEEFDNGVHPSRVANLTRAVWGLLHLGGHNVLLTTHNPATLNALAGGQMDGVVLCMWDEERQANRLMRLLDLPRSDELLERGRLGDLVTRRVVDQYLVPALEDHRTEQLKTWLQSLP